MHKIFARATLRTSAGVLLLRPLYAARFSNRRAEDATARFVISVFPSPRPSPSPPRHTTKLFPHAQFADDNAPCHGTLACRTSRARCVSSPLSRSLFLTLNSRLPHYLPFHRPPSPPRPSSLVAAVSRPSSFISSVILAWCFLRSPFLPCNHIHPGEYRAPSFRGSRLC